MTMRPAIAAEGATEVYVRADPYDFPFNGDLRPENTVVMVIDMQKDFCASGGYFHAMGYDVAPMMAVVEPIRRVLAAARGREFHIMHTRQGRRPDLSDLPEVARWRSRRGGAEIGAPGPMGRFMIRGERGFQIIDELRPEQDEPVIDKAGSGAFYGTDLELLLHHNGIVNMVFTGITTDVCVHSTIREATDRGFDCLLLEDCCAATLRSNHVAALSMIKQEGGYFGSIATSDAFVDAITEPSHEQEAQSVHA
ncbi:MAG: isochorismatase family cysteine hydrolase [Alphaproteobacteria bacterium]|nr:isochorismatase family cysteine hydrolase [Alphaproteobacteria bacterium]